MLNIFTVDIEDWYHTNDFYFQPDKWDNFQNRIEYGTKMILELLSRYNVKATFFVLGHVALNNPALIKEIADAGHEIGSHGMYHRMICNLSKDEFREDLRLSKKLLEEITGQKIQLFRAPSWSVSIESLWMFEVLEEEGFIGDSSVQPFRTPLSGMNNVPVTPFHPIINDRTLNLVEFPSTVITIGNKLLPFAGGFYLRALPLKLVAWLLKMTNKERTGMIYVHPWELDIAQPRIKAPKHIEIAHYLNLDTTQKKIEQLLQKFSFCSLGFYIKHNTFSSQSLK